MPEQSKTPGIEDAKTTLQEFKAKIPGAPEAEALIAELVAIVDRVASATKTCEKAIVASQFGQRIEHLVDRLKEFIEPPPPGVPA